MSETAEKFSVAARDPNPSFEHWSTYLTDESKKTVIEEWTYFITGKRSGEGTADLAAIMSNTDMAGFLCILAPEKDLTILDKILEAGVPIDIRDKDGAHGLTALQMRANRVHPQGMAALLERGADPEIRDRDGYSALDHVVTAGRLSTRVDSDFLRRLMREGSWESDRVRGAIQILAERGADLYAQDADGHTAFANAILSLKPEAVKAFLDMADAGEFDLLGRKVSGNLTAAEFCKQYSEGTDALSQICYYADVQIQWQGMQAQENVLHQVMAALDLTHPFSFRKKT